MSITITFKCGRTVEWADERQKPECGCGCNKVTRVKAPPPRFIGSVRGPNATEKNLEPVRVDLTTKEPGP